METSVYGVHGVYSHCPHEVVFAITPSRRMVVTGARALRIILYIIIIIIIIHRHVVPIEIAQKAADTRHRFPQKCQKY